MRGKNKCKILKEIRQRIADENDIPYVTRECTYQGDCLGTCPKCESELRYLERELAKREARGKRVAVAALCAGMTFSVAGCGLNKPIIGGEPDIAGMMEYSEPDSSEEVFVTEGEVAWPEDESGTAGPEIQGGIAAPESGESQIDESEFELMGDVAYIPESGANG